MPDLSSRAETGATIAVRATPRARRNALAAPDDPADPVKVWVTAPPADGEANDAVRKLLAKALGVPPGRLTLVRGATSRDKVFQLD
jgi:uncharacterized protein